MGTASVRLRRDLVRAAVQDNVYIKAGKRPPVHRPRRLGRWLALGLVVPALAGAATLVLVSAAPRQVDGQAHDAAQRGAAPTRAAGAVATAPAPEPVPSLGSAPRRLDAAVFPVGVRRIVLDPGHGGKDVGTETAGGLFEKDIALDIALRLRDLLQKQGGVEVLMTRDKDEQVLLRDRARFANEHKADLFVSIHLNSLGAVTTRGLETFYLGATDDPELVKLAGAENVESGYSLADVRRLLDGIYLDLRGKESARLAGSVQKALFRALDAQAPLRDRGVKSAPFLVLVGTDMPAILAEVSCLSSEKDAELLAAEPYRQGIAEALRAGIQAYTLDLTHEPAAVAAKVSPSPATPSPASPAAASPAARPRPAAKTGSAT